MQQQEKNSTANVTAPAPWPSLRLPLTVAPLNLAPFPLVAATSASARAIPFAAKCHMNSMTVMTENTSGAPILMTPNTASTAKNLDPETPAANIQNPAAALTWLVWDATASPRMT